MHTCYSVGMTTTTCLHCDGTDPLTAPDDADWAMCPTCEAAEIAAESSALRFA